MTQQYSPPQPAYYAPAAPVPSNGVATAGFIVALVGAVLALIPIVGTVSWVISPVGLVLSAVGLGLVKSRGGAGRGMAEAGVVLGIAGIVVCLGYTFLFAHAVSSTPSIPSTSSSASTYRPTTSSYSSSTDADARFLSVLRSNGVAPTGSDAAATGIGHAVCGRLDGGASVASQVYGILGEQGNRFTNAQAAAVVGASIGAYCPQHYAEVQDG